MASRRFGPSRGWRALVGMTGLVCFVAALPAAPAKSSRTNRAALALQVALDRAGISPGLIDGRPGAQTTQALTVFQRAHGLPDKGTLDRASRAALKLASLDATQSYVVTDADVTGPFINKLPGDLMAQGDLPALSYGSVAELLAERFHTDEPMLRRLNPKARFAARETLQVPNVEAMALPAESKRRDGTGKHATQTATVVVSRTPALVMVLDAAGRLLFAAPVTSGSEHDPLPIGQWTVTDVYLLPTFHYNPALFWDADPSHAKTTIQPGPNNPVGVAWIDINREHYGLHGTPEPRTIGRSASHGCVRLTNWDVARLLEFVKPGTQVVFDEQPVPLRAAS